MVKENRIRILTWDTATKLVREFLDQVIVEAILQWSKNNNGACVFQFFLTHSLIRQNHIFCLLKSFSVAGRWVPVSFVGLSTSPFEGSQFGEVEATFTFGAERGGATSLIEYMKESNIMRPARVLGNFYL